MDGQRHLALTTRSARPSGQRALLALASLRRIVLTSHSLTSRPTSGAFCSSTSCAPSVDVCKKDICRVSELTTVHFMESKTNSQWCTLRGQKRTHNGALYGVENELTMVHFTGSKTNSQWCTLWSRKRTHKGALYGVKNELTMVHFMESKTNSHRCTLRGQKRTHNGALYGVENELTKMHFMGVKN